MGCRESLDFPAWYRDYSAALREKDRLRLFQRIESAESKLLTRLESLVNEVDGHAEREAIADALNQLSFLKADRLGFRP